MHVEEELDVDMPAWDEVAVAAVGVVVVAAAAAEGVHADILDAEAVVQQVAGAANA